MEKARKKVRDISQEVVVLRTAKGHIGTLGVRNREVQKKSPEHFPRSRVVADCEGAVHRLRRRTSAQGSFERRPVSAAGKFHSEKFRSEKFRGERLP